MIWDVRAFIFADMMTVRLFLKPLCRRLKMDLIREILMGVLVVLAILGVAGIMCIPSLLLFIRSIEEDSWWMTALAIVVLAITISVLSVVSSRLGLL
jgi:hypothetical protein